MYPYYCLLLLIDQLSSRIITFVSSIWLFELIQYSIIFKNSINVSEFNLLFNEATR